ncbi:MAG: alpha/beta hydrolase [Bifidobacteriaceae bacterium]|jgi:acetyl esterase/lipase|nr:alpha/beta hydrolase [Bifidobacteriaceae bacterium]
MASINIVRNIAYGADPRHRLDLYRPARLARGAVLVIHGGGWWTGDKAGVSALAGTLASAGYLAVAPNYRLATAHKNNYPTQVEDVAAALGWLRSSDLPYNRALIAAVGSSSGGNLAIELGLRYGVPSVSWSGLLNLDGFVADHPGLEPKRLEIDPNGPPSTIDQTGANDAYYLWCIQNLMGGKMSLIRQATPIHRVTPHAGPMFLAGSLREFVPAKEIALMVAAAIAAGVGVECMVLPGSAHGDAYMADAIRPTMVFLDRYLG